MRLGTLSEHTLENSVLKNVNKCNACGKNVHIERDCWESVNVDISYGKNEYADNVGKDYSVTNGMVSSDGFGETPLIAFNKAMNNFACSLGIPTGIRLFILVPENTKPSMLARWMEEFSELAAGGFVNISSEREEGQMSPIPIIGGHTEVSRDINAPKFYVTVMGSDLGFSPSRKNIPEGYSIVMAGNAGILGTNLLISRKSEYLKTRFAGPYIDSAVFADDELSVRKYAEVIKELDGFECDSKCDTKDILFLHDVSFGGVYSALWQLGAWMNKGFMIDNRKIPIKQETIEICEQFDINPYLIDGTGALLIVCKKGQKVVDLLREKNLTAEIIGEVTSGRERLVMLSPTDIRTLSPVDGDDITTVL